MKKYELKKDFPSSKIGDVWVKTDNGFMSPEGRETIKMHEHLFEPFNDWFEDYEEQEEFWYINECGDVLKYKYDGGCSSPILEAKEIGNYFETEEEAEQEVKKLKAWKRLKDMRFKIGSIKYNLYEESSSHITYDGYITIKGIAYEDFVEDLDLLLEMQND